jgi:hypothetical protein
MIIEGSKILWQRKVQYDNGGKYNMIMEEVQYSDDGIERTSYNKVIVVSYNKWRNNKKQQEAKMHVLDRKNVRGC